MVKSLLLSAAAMTFSLFASGQEDTYYVTDNASVENLQEYKDALNEADLHQYRLVDERRSFTFKSGLTFELLSANELAGTYPNEMANVSLTSDDLNESFQPIFTLTDGILGIEYGSVQSLKTTSTVAAPSNDSNTDTSEIEGFPVKKDTGDPEADEAAYNEAKAAWLEANPDAAEEMNTTNE